MRESEKLEWAEGSSTVLELQQWPQLIPWGTTEVGPTDMSQPQIRGLGLWTPASTRHRLWAVPEVGC